MARTFPHARYMSFNSYRGQSAYDVIEDDLLAPSGGVGNPLQEGNSRAGTVNYAMTVLFSPVPEVESFGVSTTPLGPAAATLQSI